MAFPLPSNIMVLSSLINVTSETNRFKKIGTKSTGFKNTTNYTALGPPKSTTSLSQPIVNYVIIDKLRSETIQQE